MARLTRELEAAYRRTSYTAETPRGVITLRIGEPCPELAELMREHGAKTAAYLTAVNPGSVRLSQEDNQKRIADLDALLSREGLTYFEGKAIADDRDWPDEESRLILGIRKYHGEYLGYLLDQKAILIILTMAGLPAITLRVLPTSLRSTKPSIYQFKSMREDLFPNETRWLLGLAAVSMSLALLSIIYAVPTDSAKILASAIWCFGLLPLAWLAVCLLRNERPRLPFS
ncbi:MAG: DUF3293 domain-containing protein [Phycisphaeraceae bacterium]